MSKKVRKTQNKKESTARQPPVREYGTAGGGRQEAGGRRGTLGFNASTAEGKTAKRQNRLATKKTKKNSIKTIDSDGNQTGLRREIQTKMIN